MKKVFITLSFEDRDELREEIGVIVSLLKEIGYEAVVFVNDFSFSPDSLDREMMDAALSEIASSDIVIAELSHKAIGVGLEIGYAKALKKKIIYLRKDDSEYSKTVGGVSDEIIVYQNIDDLKSQLKHVV